MENGSDQCHITGMNAKSPKRPRDPNQLAKMVVDIATGEREEAAETATEKRASKAGKKGGPARANALTAEQRSEIASIAAQARWKKT
jgi:hypothetical protein